MKQMLFRTIIVFISIFSAMGMMAQGTQGTGPVKTIIVDAGHGGPDVGARGTVTTEAAVNLAVSLKLAAALRKTLGGINILETRTHSGLPGGLNNAVAANRFRADFANKSNGDLFISLHCNAAGRSPGGWYVKKVVGRTAHTKTVTVGKGKKKKKVKKTVYVNKYEDVWVENKARGTETYIWAVGKNEQKVSSMKAVVDEEDRDYYSEEGGDEPTEGLTLPDPNDPAERIRMLIYAQHYFRKSYNLATLVEKGFIASGRTSRGVQQRNHKGIWVLQATGMPSILIEMGFISNKEDEKYLMSEEGQAEMVTSIVAAVKTYVDQYNHQPASEDLAARKGEGAK